MTTSIQERLAAADGHYQAGKNLSTDGLPDNSYKFQLQDIVIEESQSSGRLQLHVELYVLEGEHAGEVDHEYMGLETDWGCRFAMEFIEKLGREAPDALDAGMEEVVSEIAEANPVFIAQIKTNKSGYKNLQNRTIKLISGKAELDAGATPGEAAEAAEPAEADAGEEPVGVGDNVVCSLDEGEEEGNVYEVTSIDDDQAKINDGTDEFTVDLDTLEAVEVEEAEAAAAPDEDDDERAELVNLAQSLDVEVTDDDSAEDIVAKLKKFEFDKSQLLKEEIELCEQHGIKLTEPAPKPKAKTKTKTKAKAKAKTKTKAKAKTKKKSKKK